MKNFSKKIAVLCFVAATILFTAVFTFFPRNLSSLFTQNKAQDAPDINEPALTLLLFEPFPQYSENEKVILTEEEYTELWEDISATRVRRKIFPKKSFSGQPIVDIVVTKIDGKEKYFGQGTYYLSDNVLSIEGKQYKCYSDNLKEEIFELLTKQKQ